MRTICIFNWKCFPQFSVIFIFFVLHFNILFSYFLIKTSKSASRKPVLSDWQGGQHGSGIFVPKRGVQGLNANEANAENRFFFFWLERATFEYLSRNRTCPNRNPLTKLLKELAQQLPHHSWDLRGRKFWFAAKLQLWLALSLSLACSSSPSCSSLFSLVLLFPYSPSLSLLHFLFEL